MEYVKMPVVELPLGATEDRVCGTIDFERALIEGGWRQVDCVAKPGGRYSGVRACWKWAVGRVGGSEPGHQRERGQSAPGQSAVTEQ